MLKVLKTPTAGVTISIERLFPDSQDVKCRYTIEWPEHTQHGYSMGIDAQTLLTGGIRQLLRTCPAN
ncbi:MAG: DUF6968 family protein [Methylocella sp.]